jgi:hypothetical protein
MRWKEAHAPEICLIGPRRGQAIRGKRAGEVGHGAFSVSQRRRQGATDFGHAENRLPLHPIKDCDKDSDFTDAQKVKALCFGSLSLDTATSELPSAVIE